MTRAYIGLGSNLADPLQQLRSACTALAALPHTEMAAVASVYASAPMGPQDQPDFLNTVAAIDTKLDPLPLLGALQAIEQQQLRQREQRWGPRTIDLDILLYGDVVVNTPRLVIPHPGLPERNFVLVPLQELTGSKLVLPGGEELGTLAANCGEGALQRTSQTLDINRHRDRETRA